MTTGEFNPYQAPAADLLDAAEVPEPGELRPVPFEDTELEPRFWPRVWAMFQALFKDPLRLAEQVPVTSGLAAPWRFQMVLTIPLFLLLLLIAAVFGTLMFTLSTGTKANGAPAWLFGLMPLLYLVILPPLQFVNMIVIGAMSHGCLWLWGGLKESQGSTATLRLTGYFLGFFMIVGFIPIIGSLAALAGPAFLGMAMARIHRTDTWRGICAAYTPLVVLCCGFIGLFVVILGFNM
jgi:hypothetical protein